MSVLCMAISILSALCSLGDMIVVDPLGLTITHEKHGTPPLQNAIAL